MIKLSDGGAYLINGIDIVEDSASAVNEVAAKTGCSVTKEEAAKNTIAYGILEGHNTSGNMEKLKIKFDKMTSHDITFVSDIQTEMSIFRMLDRGYIFIKSIDFMIFFQEKFCTALPDPGCCACDQDFHQAKFSFILLRNAVIRTAATAIHRTLSM